MILRATVGALTLNAQQELAADVAGDGSVDINDAVLLLRYTVGAITRFPVAQNCNSDWAFVPEPEAVANQTVLPPEIGSGTCQTTGTVCYEPLITQANNQNFSAVLFGDCNGDWHPGGGLFGGLTARAEAVSALRVQRGGRNGEVLRVPVALNTAGAQGLSADLSYDASLATAVGVRAVGRNGQVLLQSNLETPGLARVALLSTTPMPRGTAFVLELALKHRRAATPSVKIQHAAVGR